MNAVSLTATLSDYIGRRFIHGFNRFFVFHISSSFDSKIIRNPPVAFNVDSNVTLKIFEVRRENAANLPAKLSLPLVYNFNSITVNTNVDIGLSIIKIFFQKRIIQ